MPWFCSTAVAPGADVSLNDTCLGPRYTPPTTVVLFRFVLNVPTVPSAVPQSMRESK